MKLKWRRDRSGRSRESADNDREHRSGEYLDMELFGEDDGKDYLVGHDDRYLEWSSEPELSVDTPELVIGRKFWEQILGWTRAASGEVSGIGCIRVDGCRFVLEEVYLPRQTCSAAGTEIDEDDLARLILDAHSRGKSHHFHWHSHGHMGVFWSSTDRENMARFSPEWMVGLVVNKSGQSKACLCIREPAPVLMDIPLRVARDQSIDIQCAAEVKERVREVSYSPPALRPWLTPTGIHSEPSSVQIKSVLRVSDNRSASLKGRK